MRIAIFSEVYWPMVSGVSLTLSRTVDALIRRGHAVRVYTASYPLPAGATERPEVHRSKSRPFFLSPEVRWAGPSYPAVAADLECFAPDVVHLATEFPMGVMGLRVARRLHRPIVMSAHTDYDRYASRYRVGWAVAPGWMYLRWFYGFGKAVLAPTERYADRLRRRGVGRVGVWSRGVDTERFSPAHRSIPYRRALGIEDDALVVSYVGRIAPEKGIDMLLDAWPTIARLHPKAHLVFTGSGMFESAIRARALPRVHLTGVKRDGALSAAYASADVFAMPSVTETFGNVTLEAMASGLATVAMAAGGALSLGEDGHNVLLADPSRPVDFVAGLDRLLSDDRLRGRLAAGGRATALRRGWGPVVDGLVEWYRLAAGDSEELLAAA